MGRNNIINKNGNLDLERLGENDEQLAKNSAQLADIAINLNAFPKQDQDDDDSARLQRAVDYAKQNNKEKILVPFDTYTISTPIMFDFDNIEIDFQGSTVNWEGTSDLGDSNGANRDYGFINLWGTRGEKLPEIINFIPEIIISNTGSHANYMGGLEFSSDLSDSVPIGSFVEIDLSTGDTESVSDYNPVAKAMCRVIGYGTNIMYIEYSSPFGNWNELTKKDVYQVTPIQNIKISNLNYVDIVPESGLSNPTAEDRQSWVAGISLKHAHNITIENFTAKGHKFPAIMTDWVHTLNVNNIYASYPSETSAGCGYGIQNNKVMYANIRNFYGNGNRHLIDFSSAAFCNVLSAGESMTVSDVACFDLHGICEHHISFTNTIGGFFAGNGYAEFPMLSKNIKLNNHTGGFYIVYIEDLVVDNSDLTIFGATGHLNYVTITSSKITINTDIYYASSRGGLITDSYFKVIDSDITIRDMLEAGTKVGFSGYKSVDFLNCNLYDDTSESELQGYIRFENIQSSNIIGGINNGVGLEKYGGVDYDVFRAECITFIYDKTTITGNPYFISLQPTELPRFSILLDKNVLINNHTLSCRLLRTPKSDTSNCDISVTNNNLVKNISTGFVTENLPNSVWNSHGNFLDGLANSTADVLSKGVLVSSDSKTIENVIIADNGRVSTPVQLFSEGGRYLKSSKGLFSGASSEVIPIVHVLDDYEAVVNMKVVGHTTKSGDDSIIFETLSTIATDGTLTNDLISGTIPSEFSITLSASGEYLTGSKSLVITITSETYASCFAEITATSRKGSVLISQ